MGGGGGYCTNCINYSGPLTLSKAEVLDYALDIK